MTISGHSLSGFIHSAGMPCRTQKEEALNTYLFVDLDHTVMRNPFQSCVFPPIAAELAEKTGQTAAGIIELIVVENEQRLARQSLPPETIMDWDDIVRVVAGRLNVSCGLSPLALVKAHAAPPDTQALDGSHQVLAALSLPSHRRVIASTMGLSKYQIPVLAALALDKCFSDLLAPDICGFLKTDRRFFGKYSGSAGLFVTIGDNYYDDIAAPKSFGFRAIWLPRAVDRRVTRDRLQAVSPFERWDHVDPRAEFSARPDAIALSLFELPAIVEALENDARHQL